MPMDADHKKPDPVSQVKNRPKAELRELTGGAARVYALVFLGVGISTWIKDCLKSALLPRRRLAPFTFAELRKGEITPPLEPKLLESENDREIFELSQSMAGAKGLVTDFDGNDSTREPGKTGTFEFILKDRRQTDSIERRVLDSSRGSYAPLRPLILESLLVEAFEASYQERDKSDENHGADAAVETGIEKTVITSSHLRPKNPN